MWQKIWSLRAWDLETARCRFLNLTEAKVEGGWLIILREGFYNYIIYLLKICINKTVQVSGQIRIRRALLYLTR